MNKNKTVQKTISPQGPFILELFTFSVVICFICSAFYHSVYLILLLGVLFYLIHCTCICLFLFSCRFFILISSCKALHDILQQGVFNCRLSCFKTKCSEKLLELNDNWANQILTHLILCDMIEKIKTATKWTLW